MGYGHASFVRDFVKDDEDTLIGRLIGAVGATGISTHRSTQVEAWRKSIRLLKEQLSDPRFCDWFIVLEYEIPRRSRRPDVILLSSTSVFVMEFKIGAQDYDSASQWQTRSYAQDLRDFHAGSDGRRIVPVLCATNAARVPLQEPRVSDLMGVTDLVRSTGSDLNSLLKRWDQTYSQYRYEPITPNHWLDSPYRPTPTIIEAATLLYEGHGVREITHSHSQNLDKTTAMLMSEIADAREYGRRVVCFVTGVPGAGKTLTGLNVVHSSEFNEMSSPSGIFLSGNGPLVKVVREALVKNQVAKGRKKGESQREASTFIQNVHSFLRHYIRERSGESPYENVVVFDEAQRAWDSQHMNRKEKIDASEANLLLEVMERLPDWAVVVALVGGGQEIFLGEAGLEEWGRALGARPVPWRVVASPEVLTGGDSVAGHKLFDGTIPNSVSFEESYLAHLDVVVRSHRARQWAGWVNEFLDLRLDNARQTFPDIREFPCYVTREIETARAWLRMRHSLEPEERTGLVASSVEGRLRAYGLEMSSGFRRGYPYEKWFLEQSTDIRSSFSLEVAASEFECQGLELDWVGVCWGGDLTPQEGHATWDYRKFRGARWNNVRKTDEQVYTLNRYRVLLTRARKGLVIWVPKGDSNDSTRDPAGFDRVFYALRMAGVPPLDRID